MRMENIIISDEIFNEIKEASIKLWGTHDDGGLGYATEKINYIKDLPNSSTNVAKIIRMFDHWHQKAIAGRISLQAKRVIRECIMSGWPKQTRGQDLEQNAFFKV